MKKFVIVKDNNDELSIRLSNCVECHFELVSEDIKCVGGGHFHIDGNNIYLYGTSIDYGRPSMKDCKEALVNTLSSWMNHKFYYSEEENCPLSLDAVVSSPSILIYNYEELSNI